MSDTIKKKALLIGNSEFKDSRIHPLLAPKEDILRLRDLLLDPAIGGFDSVKCEFDLETTDVGKQISDLFEGAGPRDLVLLYYAGHGIRDISGKLYLATYNTDTAYLKASALPASYILGDLRNSPSKKKVVILDCCHAGAAIDGILSRSATDAALLHDNFNSEGEGTYILAACKAGESAFESKDGKYSIYTKALTEAIRTGNAAPEKEMLTVGDIHNYVRDTRLYNSDTQQINPHTEPVMLAVELDELELCRNPDVRLPINENVIVALSDQQYLTRKGAIGALEDIISGTDLFQAKTAMKLLEERLPIENDKRLCKEIEEIIASRKIASLSPSIPRGDEKIENSVEIRVLNFLKNWPSWAFTLEYVKSWGGKQSGFEDLNTIPQADILDALEKLTADGKIESLISDKGNVVFQYKSIKSSGNVVIMEPKVWSEILQLLSVNYRPVLIFSLIIILSLIMAIMISRYFFYG